MSDLLTAAAQVLGAPEGLVKRSAEARAKAAGVAVDDILSAWAGGAAVTAAPAMSSEHRATSQPAENQQPAPATPSGVTVGGSQLKADSSTLAPRTPNFVMVPQATVEGDVLVEPLPLSERVGLAGKIGAYTGTVLGVLGMLIASPWLLPNASITGTEGNYGPSVLVKTSTFTLGAALLSIAYGLVVAALSRTLSGWLQPGAALQGRHGVTGFMGAGVGLVLGLMAGAVLTSAFGAPVEGAQGLVDLPISSGVIVVLLGGALLGWLTAALVQVVGVPDVLRRTEIDEVRAIRSRLATAVSVPLAAVVSLGLLVLPFALVLIRSNHMTKGGAAVLAIMTAASVLAVSGLAASRPGMRITRGEFFVAVGGIGVVVLIVFAVFLARGGGAEHAEPAAGGETTTTVASA